MRTVAQHRDDKTFTYVPSAKGHIKSGSLQSFKFDPQYFPDLSQAKVLRVVRITDFEMEFPVASILDGIS